jgi:outer membrane biosynthesis protein TonB
MWDRQVAIASTHLPMLREEVNAQRPEGQRKILNKIPQHPELARQMNLAGAVKLAVYVAPNGSVKSTQTVGRNPVLLKAAQGALYKWKWAPAA